MKARLAGILSVSLPYLLVIAAASGVSLTLMLHRFDLTVTSLIYVIPMLLAAIILFIARNRKPASPSMPEYGNRTHYANIFLLSCLTFVLATIVLVSSDTRPLAYFILLSLYSGMLLLQILWRRPKWTDTLIVVQILALSLNLTLGFSLKYPLYFGDTDTLVHLRLIDLVLQTGHVNSLIVDYQNYPLYHILNAIGVQTTGLKADTSLFIVMGLSWQTGIVFAYLTFKYVSKSGRLTLIAALLFASSSQIIFYGTYSIARSLAFVFMMAWLYLIIFRAQRDPKALSLSLIFLAAMIVTHHLNVLFLIPVLVVVIVCQFLVTKVREERVINPVFVYLFALCAISYLLFVASGMSVSALTDLVNGMFQTGSSVVGDPTAGYGFSAILGIAYYSFVVLLSLLGLRTILLNGKFSLNTPASLVVGLSGFLLLLVYVPGPLDLFQVSQVALTQRLQLVVTPFVIFTSVLGVQYLYIGLERITASSMKTSVFLWLVPGLLTTMFFFSTMSLGDAQDGVFFSSLSKFSSPYFTDSELNSFSFLNGESGIGSSLYTDYQASRNVYSLSNVGNLNIMASENISYIPTGYVLMRTEELHRKGALTVLKSETITNLTIRYRLDQFYAASGILSQLAAEYRIYDSGAVQIFFVPPSPPQS